MEQTTDRRNRLKQLLAEMDVTPPEPSRRDQLMTLLEKERRSFSTKKLAQSAGVDGAETLASTLEAAGLYGERGRDIGSAAVDVITPGAMDRRPRASFTPGLGRGPLRVGNAPVEGESPVERVERVRNEEAMGVGQTTRPIAQAAFGAADRVRAWGDSIGYVPSDGFVPSLLESAAGSVPQLAGGMASTAAGTAAGGPAVGLASGASFFAATDGGAHTSEVYKKLIADGVSPDEALTQATNSGVVYAAVSGALEYVGLDAILRGRKLGRAVKEVAERPQWVRAFGATAGAAMTEGSTEVLQGAVGETLEAYARDNWDEFKTKFTASDEPLQEFMVGAMLGGAVRGGAEALSPSNYTSFADWVSAKRGAKEANMTAGEKLDAMVRDRLARGKDEAVDVGQEAPVESRTTPATALENGVEGNPSPVADAAENAQKNNLEGGVDINLRFNPQQQGEEANKGGGSENDFGDVDLTITGQRGNDNNNDRQNSPEAEPGEGLAPVADFVRLHGTAPVSERAAQRFAQANGIKTIQQIQPETNAQRRAVTFYAERGVPLHLVKSADESNGQLRVPAIWTSDGVVMDANAGSGEYLRSLVYHEAFHDLKRRNPEVWENSYNTVRELDPDGLRAAEQQYFADAQSLGVDVDTAGRSDEALSRYAEGFSAWLESAAENPQKIRDLAENNPGVVSQLVDAIQRAMRKIGVYNGRTILERRGDSQSAAQLALELNEALDTLIGTDGGLESLSGREIDPELQSAASVATPDQVFTPRAITVADVRTRKPGEFSNRDIRRRIKTIGEENGFDRTDAIDLSEEQQVETGHDMISMAFPGKIPAEITDALQGLPRRVRRQFQADVPSGRGDDMLSSLGADEMIRRATVLANPAEQGAADFLGDNAEITEDLGMIRAVMDLRGAKPVRDYAPIETLENPGLLPDGATFEIEGSEFVVYTPEGGGKRAAGDAGHDFNLDGVEAVPITKRSLRKRADAEAPAKSDPMDDLPFAVAPATNSHKFRKWFGDSKVVDENGKPLVVYHGTSAEFNQFEDRGGIGHYFTEFPSEASHFAQSYRREPRGQKMIPAYLSIKNPLDALSDEYKSISRSASGGNPRGMISSEAKRRGYDGIVWNKGGDGFAQIIAFDPTQIKSAVGNNGEYDPANPDIRFAVRDTKGQSLIENLPDPPKPSRGFRKFIARNNSDGMFDGIDPTPQTSFDAAMLSIRRTVQDKFLPVLMAQRAVENAGGRVTDSTNVYRAETLYYGRSEERARKFQKEMVEPILRDLHENEIPLADLDQYLYALHAPERNRAIRETNPEFDGEAGSGMTDTEAAGIVERVESGEKAQAFKKLADQVAAIREWSLNYMVENDLLSEAQAAEWRSTYEHYVPLRSADPGTGPVSGNGGGRGFEVRGAESKRAKGRKSKADSPLIFMIHQADRAIVRAERNRVGLAFMRLILNNPEPGLWSVIKPTRKVAGKPDLWGNSDVEIVPNPLAVDARRNPNTIVIKEKGEERYLEVNNEDLVRAYKNLGTAHMPPALALLSKFMRIRSALVTSYSPEFLLTNFVRDIQTASFNITAERDADLAKRVVKNVRKAIGGAFEATRSERRTDETVEGEWAKTFREYVEDGGKTGWAGAYSFEDRASEIEKSLKNIDSRQAVFGKMLRGVRDLIEDANTSIENGVRVSLYSELRKSGVSRPEAAEAAKNLTVNFNRRGELGTLLNSLYLFFNAGIQGSARMVQAVNTPKGRKLAMGVVGTGLAMGLLNSMLSDEDDDGELFYDKISPWERSNNFILMLPGTGGRYVKFPLPYGYSALYSIGSHGASAVRGEQSPGESLGHMGASAINSFNPLGGGLGVRDLAPEIVKPVLEINLNKDFKDSPINPTKYPGDNKPRSESYFSSTSVPSRFIAKTINSITGGDEVRPGLVDISPGTLDHLADFAGGSAIRFLKEAVIDIPSRLFTDEEMTIRGTPFIRRFMGTPSEYRHKRDFYENRGRMEALRSFEKGYLESEDYGRVEAFRKEQGPVLEAAHTFDLYRRVIDDLRNRQEDGDTSITDESIEQLYFESNRMVRSADRGEPYETPLLDKTRGVGKMRRDARRRLRKLESRLNEPDD